MMMRVTLRSVDDEWDRIRFDVSIDEHNRIKKERIYFGFEGLFNEAEGYHHVMLNEKGFIDLGDGFEAYSRYHKINLLEKEIKLKEYTTIWWKNGLEITEATYYIEAITPLD